MMNGHIVTDRPLSMFEIHAKHGGARKLESSGARLIPHKPAQPPPLPQQKKPAQPPPLPKMQKSGSYFANLRKKLS